VEWVHRLGLLYSEREYAHLAKSRIAWLTARAFPKAAPAVLQLAVDWTTLFCIIDDRVEQGGLPPLRLAAYLERLLGAFRNGAGDCGDPLARALIDIRDRMLTLASPAWVERFADRLEELFTGYPMETIYRGKQLTPDLSTYRTLREMTIGLYPHFHFHSIVAGVELPLEIRQHPLIRRLETAACTCVGWANDIFTYEKELQVSEVNNVVFVLRDQHSLSLDQALVRAIGLHNAELREFMRMESMLPDFWRWTPTVRSYVDMLRAWIRGHLDWAVETGRYRPELGMGGFATDEQLPVVA
jgi:hypothetical protein